MKKESLNQRSTKFFIVVALLAVAFLWGGVYFIPVYLSYAFDQGAEESVGVKNKNSAHQKQRKEATNSVKDPFITKNPNIKDSPSEPQINSSNPVLGDSGDPVTIVQFSDFKCEFCHQQEQIFQDLKKDHEDKIRLVWKDYPDSNHRSSSWQAAKAARCAQKQDKFWSYHDRLYETNEDLNQKTFLELAQKMNLNLNDFRSCLRSSQVNELIKKDIDEANSLGISGIPFLYVNGREFMGKINKQELKKIIEMEMKNEK